MFIAKYDENGTCSWARKIGGTASDYPTKIVTDNKDLYITGFSNSLKLNFYDSDGNIDMSFNRETDTTTQDPNTQDSTTDIYIAKYDAITFLGKDT